MDAYNFFRIYHPLRLHFTSSYDVFKYNGKTKTIDPEKFGVRRDQGLFSRMGSMVDSRIHAGQFCVSNFVANGANWLYLDPSSCKESWDKWKTDKNSIKDRTEYTLKYFKSLAKEKGLKYTDLFNTTKNKNKPPVLQMFLQSGVDSDVMITLTHNDGHLKRWYSEYENDPLVSDRIFTLMKYEPFVLPLLKEDK
jgi:hypothetical protein